jgi:hypothetical protein
MEIPPPQYPSFPFIPLIPKQALNLALLARQAWRIVQGPESLSARVLEAAYYLDGDFLEAGIGSTPSQDWRVIVEGKEVPQQG